MRNVQDWVTGIISYRDAWSGFLTCQSHSRGHSGPSANKHQTQRSSTLRMDGRIFEHVGFDIYRRPLTMAMRGDLYHDQRHTSHSERRFSISLFNRGIFIRPQSSPLRNGFVTRDFVLTCGMCDSGTCRLIPRLESYTKGKAAGNIQAYTVQILDGHIRGSRSRRKRL